MVICRCCYHINIILIAENFNFISLRHLAWNCKKAYLRVGGTNHWHFEGSLVECWLCQLLLKNLLFYWPSGTLFSLSWDQFWFTVRTKGALKAIVIRGTSTFLTVDLEGFKVSGAADFFGVAAFPPLLHHLAIDWGLPRFLKSLPLICWYSPKHQKFW